MRQLLPRPAGDVDLYEAYRPATGVVRLGMVMSLDGAVTDARGRTRGLSGEADREVFRVLRAHADAILVGAGTARAEGYGPHRLTADLRARRHGDGRDLPAAVVVISRSLRFDLEAPLFSEAGVPTVVLTTRAADPARLAEIERAGRVVVAGGRDVDLAEGLAALRESLGYTSLLCEGGPRLAASMLEAGLVDELCLTLAPLAVGGHGPRLVEGLPLGERGLQLSAAIEHSGELLLRYDVKDRA